jgi:hypothetical protein
LKCIGIDIFHRCGFAALATALNASGIPNIKLAELVQLGKIEGITNNGELFSCEWLFEFINSHWPQIGAKLTDFPEPIEIVKNLITIKNGKLPTILIPYDCDKNFEPCNREGHAAHWAIVVSTVIL